MYWDAANFTPISALFGGIIIGLAATLLMVFNGRIAGISGILGGAFFNVQKDVMWRGAFLVGLAITPLIFDRFNFVSLTTDFPVKGPALAIGGLLVGIGSQLGNGCVSGHGVCGNARLSGRSLIATIVFIIVGIITVFISRYMGLY